MEYGVYAKPDYEVAISETFCLVFYKNIDTFGTKLYQYGKLIAICEHDSIKNLRPTRLSTTKKKIYLITNDYVPF